MGLAWPTRMRANSTPDRYNQVKERGRYRPPRLTERCFGAIRLPVRDGGARRGRGCGSLRAWNDERLANLQFPVVFDVVEFLQFVDAYFVHFRDRSERL